jgi:hypothetical protein
MKRPPLSIEERLRSAFEDRAVDIDTSPQAIFEINSRISSRNAGSGFRLQFRPSFVLAGAACAVLVAVAVLSVMQQDPQADQVGVFDNSDPAPMTTPNESTSTEGDSSGPATDSSGDAVTTVPDATPIPEVAESSTPGPATNTAVGLPSPERARVVWPMMATAAADWPKTADEAATGFVSNYLGRSVRDLDPAANNGSTATAVLRSPTSGNEASVLQLAAFDVGDGTERWAVTAAQSAMLTLDGIDVGAVLANPAVITGIGEGLGGDVLIRLFSPTESPLSALATGQATAVAGKVGAPEAFEATVGYPVDSSSAAVLVVTNDGSLGGITAIPVTTAAPVTPCEPADSDAGAITVAVFFPCETSEDGSLVRRSHTAPASGVDLLGALQALATGPTEAEVAAGLYSALPTEPGAVISVASAGGWAVVDLTPAVEASNGPLALAQLNATAFAIPSVVAVEYRIEGDCERFAVAVGEGGCRVYSRAGSFQPPVAFEPHVLVAAGGERSIHIDTSSSSESVATLVAGGAGGFRLTGATAAVDGATWLRLVGADGVLGWVESSGISVQPTELAEAQGQVMIDRALDVVAVESLGDIGRVALSDKALWVTLVTDGEYLSFLPANGLRDISAWTAERDLGDSTYPLGSTLAQVFNARSLDVISVNRAAAAGSGPPSALSGLAYISIATSQLLPAGPPDEVDPEPTDPEAEPTEEGPVEPVAVPVILNVYFDFSTGEPQVIALSAHPILPPSE